MSNHKTPKKKVLIVSGFSPVKLPQLQEMGIPVDPLIFLSNIAGKDTLRFSIPTIAPATLGSYLRQQGIDVEIADFFFDEIHSFDADIIGISSTFMGVENVKQIAGLIKEQNPSATVVLGGPLSWSIPAAELLCKVPSIDYIVKQEGEQTFVDLISVLRTGDDPRLVRGLALRSGGTVLETESRLPLESEKIPEPLWELMGIPSAKRLPVLPVETSRGCPYNCAYCSEVTYWGKPVRYRKVDRVVAEIRRNAEKFGVTTFRFTDSCFSSPPVRSAEMCDAIYDSCVRQGIPVKWSAYARIDNLSRVLLDKMKRSGCVALDIGLESGSTELLRRMGRGYSPEVAIEVAQAARDAGIITNFNVVIGFPGETEETIQATAELIDRAAPDTYACFIFYLAPNTAVNVRKTNYQMEGGGLYWKHDSMKSEYALEGMKTVVERVSQSANFPGGEYFACYLASVGYSEREIRELYQAIPRLARVPVDDEAFSVVRRAVERVRDFW